MENIGFDYSVKVGIRLTLVELDTLISMAKRHYDGRCKAAAEVGGRLYGMKNSMVLFQESQVDEYFLDGRELGLLSKIAEGNTCPFERDIYLFLMRTQAERGIEHERINKANRKVVVSGEGTQSCGDDGD